MDIYEVRYDRKTREESDIDARVYDEGHFRTINLIADSREEAIAIADKRLAKQFPEDDVYDPIKDEWSKEPNINSQSNYKHVGTIVKVKL